MFYGCSSLKSLNLSSFNFDEEIKMNYLFYHCTRLEYLDFSSVKNISDRNLNLFSDDIETEGIIKLN